MNIIKNQYSISAMSKILEISRSSIYYKRAEWTIGSFLEDRVIKIFNDSKKNYGTRKIKHELRGLDKRASSRFIGRVMAKYGLVSNYTKKQYKKENKGCIEEIISNIVARKFSREEQMEVVVSDLTYVRFGR